MAIKWDIPPTPIAVADIPVEGFSTKPTSIAMGADRPIEGLSAVERKLIAALHVDPEEWKKNRTERRRGGDFLSRTPLGRKSIERTVDGEREIGMPTGFRNV